MSNLCSEITLPTGIDKDGNRRTAVCCLSSLNIENMMNGIMKTVLLRM